MSIVRSTYISQNSIRITATEEVTDYIPSLPKQCMKEESASQVRYFSSPDLIRVYSTTH